MRRFRLLAGSLIRPALPAVLCSMLTLGFAVTSPAQAPASTLQAAASHRMIVVYRNGSIPGNAEQAAQLAGGRLLRRHERFGAAVVTGTAAVQAQLRADPNVEYVVEDRAVTGNVILPRAFDTGAHTATPVHANLPRLVLPTDTSDTYYAGSPQGWAVRAVGGFGGGVADSGAAGPWATTTGTGIRIAVLDSGVDRNHPDIAPNLVLNLSEVDRTAQTSPCDDGSPQDQTGHGTWVASLAAGAAGNGTGRTVGVAPTASLLNIKVLQRLPGAGTTTAQQCANGQASGLLSWVLQGIDDAVTQRASDVERRHRACRRPVVRRPDTDHALRRCGRRSSDCISAVSRCWLFQA